MRNPLLPPVVDPPERWWRQADGFEVYRWREYLEPPVHAGCLRRPCTDRFSLSIRRAKAREGRKW